MMRRSGKYIPCIFAALFSLQSGAAMAADYMKFSFHLEDFRRYGLGLYQVIHAEGPITQGTAGSLRVFVQENHIQPGGSVYFQSEGGDLVAGMELGEAIRELGLNTYIGGIGPDSGGTCASACTLAYLGGVWRFMSDGASYSVQRFYHRSGTNQEFELQSSKVLADRITNYMQSMGASPELFQVMLLPGNAQTVGINKDSLIKLGVINDGSSSAAWNTTTSNDGPVLMGTVTDNNGSHRLAFTCNPRNNTLSGIGYLENSDPQRVQASADSKGLLIDRDKVPLSASVKAESGYAELLFAVSPELARRLMASYRVGVYFQPAQIPYYAGFTIRHTYESQQMMKQFFNDCLLNRVAK